MATRWIGGKGGIKAWIGMALSYLLPLRASHFLEGDHREVYHMYHVLREDR